MCPIVFGTILHCLVKKIMITAAQIILGWKGQARIQALSPAPGPAKDITKMTKSIVQNHLELIL